jgi:hypothetical protein
MDSQIYMTAWKAKGVLLTNSTAVTSGALFADEGARTEVVGIKRLVVAVVMSVVAVAMEAVGLLAPPARVATAKEKHAASCKMRCMVMDLLICRRSGNVPDRKTG